MGGVGGANGCVDVRGGVGRVGEGGVRGVWCIHAILPSPLACSPIPSCI